MVTEQGHVYPQNEESQALGRKTSVTLTAAEAARYGADLKKVGVAKDVEAPRNKQITETQTK